MVRLLAVPTLATDDFSNFRVSGDINHRRPFPALCAARVLVQEVASSFHLEAIKLCLELQVHVGGNHPPLTFSLTPIVLDGVQGLPAAMGSAGWAPDEERRLSGDHFFPSVASHLLLGEVPNVAALVHRVEVQGNPRQQPQAGEQFRRMRDARRAVDLGDKGLDCTAPFPPVSFWVPSKLSENLHDVHIAPQASLPTFLHAN